MGKLRGPGGGMNSNGGFSFLHIAHIQNAANAPSTLWVPRWYYFKFFRTVKYGKVESCETIVEWKF